MNDIMSALDALAADLNEIEAEHMTDSVVIANIEPDRSDDVLAFVTVDQILAGHNLSKGDNNLTSKKILRDHEIVALERDARERMRDKRRKQIARARAKRVSEQAERDARPIDPERMAQAFDLIALVTKQITKITMPVYNRFRRVLGDTDVHDIGQRVTMSVAESLARGDGDLVALLEAAQWFSHAPMTPKGIDVDPDAPDGARMLVGTIVRLAHRSVVDTYRERTCKVITRDPVTGKDVVVDRTLESFDLIDTMARNIGTDVDTLLSKHVAGGKPSHDSKSPMILTSRLFARTAVDSWIEAKGLGWCADLMISDEHTRTDMTFKWTEHAPLIFDGFDMPTLDMTPALMAGYAKRMVRLAFKELPDVMLGIRALANDPRFMWDVTKRVLDINVMGETGVELTRRIMQDEKPRSLQEILGEMQRDLDDMDTDRSRAQWSTRRDIEFPPNLSAVERDLQNGKYFFLVGMEDGEAPVKIYQGPDASEWKKVFVSEPSTYKCEHGPRTYVRGMSKRAKKHPRPWQGHFCGLPKGDPNACEPVFRNADILLEPAQA